MDELDDMSLFQKLVKELFEREVLERLDESGSKIHDETATIKLVQDVFDELTEAADAIRRGAIQVDLSQEQKAELH